MEAKNPLRKKNPKLNEKVIVNYNLLALYIDLTIRGLIAFLTLGLFSYFILIRWLNVPIWLTLPIIFVLSIFMSPFLSRISFGQKIQNKYDNFLKGVIEKIK